MKPTQEQILSALNELVRENKTELKTEKVELGLVQDLEKALGFQTKQSKKLDGLLKESKKDLSLLSKIKDRARVVSNLNGDILEIDKKIQGYEKELLKTAKELGIKPMDMPAFKQIDKVREGISKNAKFIKDAENIFTKYIKI